MKRTLLIVVIASISAVALAQSENAAGTKQLAPELNMHSTARQSQQTQTVTCGPDTIVYPYLKEEVFAAPNDSFFIDAMVGNVRTASQAYHTADNVNIMGVQFWGAAYTPSSVPQILQVRAYLYAVDAMNMPTTVLDSALVTITEQYDLYEAYFTVPYTYGQNFAVGVRSLLNDTLAVVTNNAGNVWSPNYGEGLGWRRFGSGVWNSNLSFFGQDLEYMIWPIVTYDVTTSFNMPNDSACMNSTVNFTNLSSGLYTNPFFNLYAFDQQWGFAPQDSAFNWNYGDTPAWDNTINGSHSYSTSGSYNVTLAGEMLGYYSVCDDTFQLPLEIMPDVVSNFTYDNSAEPTIAYTDASTGAMTYMWDFGDSATSATASPSHTYAGAGTYTATLVVSGFCGTDTSTQVISILGNSILTPSGNVNNAWFNPADQQLVISLATNATIEVYGVAGNNIYSEQVQASTRTIDMRTAAAGVYFVRITSGSEVQTVKFNVVK